MLHKFRRMNDDEGYIVLQYLLISTRTSLERNFFNIINKFQGIFKSQDVESNKIL